MAKARRRRIWSGSRDCLANVRRAAASKSGRRGTGAAMALLEQTWPPRNHTHAPRTTPAHESHFRGIGMTTKILALTDALGNLVRFVLLPGQRFDTVGVPPLIDGLAFGARIGDTAFDSNDIVADLDARGAKAVIAQHPRRTTPLDIDRAMYKWRHLIENFFCKLKELKRIALRADKTDQKIGRAHV